MRTLSWLAVAAFAAVATPSVARAGGTPTWARVYMAEYSVRASVKTDAMIPAWARKLNVNCSHCHYPAAPRLNATGMRYKWAGYRTPEEFGEQVNVEKLQNYISLRGRMKYDYAKTQNQPASNSSFAFEDATIFYGGPYGRHYAAFFEFERVADDVTELVANLSGTWGNENSYGGFRAGQFHWLQREGVAGFDRPTGLRTPTPVSGQITSSVPFSFSTDQVGIEGFYVAGSNRASVEVLNGINAAGKGDEGDPDKKKDFVFIDQFLFDDAGSGLTAVGYYGTIVGLVDTVAPSQTSHFWRVGLTANKIISNFEILGSILYGKDMDLPTGAGAFGAAENKGLGYWVSGQYMFPKTPLTLFGRYEYVDPNTDVSDNADRRAVLGGVLPLGLPEYLRLALEGAMDMPQLSGAPKRYGLTAQVMLNF